MKTRNALLIAAAIALLASIAGAQIPPASTNNSQEELIQLLRRTLAEQQKSPGKIIRTYSDDAPPPAAAAAPSGKGVAATAQSPEFVELERQYLEGKITARQFQKSLERLQEEQRSKAQGTRTIPRAASPKTAIAPTPVQVPPPPGPTEATPEQKQKISAVESKLDEMIRLKAGRDQAALTNAATVTTGAQTKRQRLDALLKLVVQGKMTDAEYREKRDKIALEPD